MAQNRIHHVEHGAHLAYFALVFVESTHHYAWIAGCLFVLGALPPCWAALQRALHLRDRGAGADTMPELPPLD